MEGVSDGAAFKEAELERQVVERLQKEPELRDQLAARIAASSLALKITEEEDPARKTAAIRAWIDNDLQSAAQIGLGLARDDASGTTGFQDTVNRSISVKLVDNPGAARGIFGRLKKASKDSTNMRRDQEMSGEEQQEIIKSLFEGKGGMSGRIVTQAEDGKGPASGVSSGLAGAGYFDRLSQGNLRGYSPQLMSIQSALNARRPPGAPKLIESGKLDYATLSYPGHGMRYDLGNLERRLRQQKNFALAKALGLERKYTAAQLLDPQVGAELEAKGAGRGLPPGFARRLSALSRAAEALKGFDQAALAAQDPNKIDKRLLALLGGKQKEAARWLTIASLEEEVQRLESDLEFMSPMLLEAIAACPVGQGTKDAYKRRGESYKSTLALLIGDLKEALALLYGDSWSAQSARAETLMGRGASKRKDIGRYISDYVNTPYRLASLQQPKARWRELLDGLILRYLPNTSQGQALSKQARQKGLLVDVFEKIAAGDLEGANTVLASSEPRR